MAGKKGRSGRKPVSGVSIDQKFNTKMPVDLRHRLQAAADKNTRTLSAEIRSRLEESFLAEIAPGWTGTNNYRLNLGTSWWLPPTLEREWTCSDGRREWRKVDAAP